MFTSCLFVDFPLAQEQTPQNFSKKANKSYPAFKASN